MIILQESDLSFFFLFICFDTFFNSSNQFPLSPISYVEENINLFYKMFPKANKIIESKLMMVRKIKKK